MKILVCTMRHWTAGRRFRSLLLNAPKLGHEMFGLASDWYADQDLTIAAFNELGAQAFPKQGWQATIERLNPDVVFGEHLFPTDVERRVQDWVNSQNKIGLIINHDPHIIQSTHRAPKPEWTRTYLSVTSQQQAHARATCYTGERAIQNWPQERIFVLGSPDLDFVTESVDVAEVRDRLGLSPNQPLIGLFPTLAHAADREELTTLVGRCQGAGWQVVIHLHPVGRRLQNSKPPHGFWVYDRGFVAADFWPKIQAMGARFIADYAPGRVCGVEFHRCQSFELLRAADCLIGTWDPFFEAYALKRGYTLLESIAAHCLKYPSHKDVFDHEFELQGNFSKISQILERGNDSEQDPGFVEKWLFKLDGLWWKRALDLAEQLVRDNA